jgi:hypothetical protein
MTIRPGFGHVRPFFGVMWKSLVEAVGVELGDPRRFRTILPEDTCS